MKRFRNLLIGLLFLAGASSAQALTVVTRYVNTDCANNGDGTGSGCAASGGAAGAYNTLANAEADVQNDNANLVTSDLQVDIICSGDTPDGATTFEGITTSTANFIRVQAAAAWRHGGKYDESKYMIVSTASTTGQAITVSIRHIRVEYCQLVTYRGTAMYPSVLTNGAVAAGGTDWRFHGNFIVAQTDWDDGNSGGVIQWSDNDITTTTLSSNIIWMRGGGGPPYAIGFNPYDTAATAPHYVFNNIFWGGYQGLNRQDGSVRLHNNVSGGNSNADYTGTIASTTYNAAEDTTATGTGALTNQTYPGVFVSTTTGDFRLNSTDTILKDTGRSDLNSSYSPYIYTVDYQAENRGATWDRGADEYVAETPPAAGGTSTGRRRQVNVIQ